MDTPRRGDWITTYSGGRAYPLDLRPEDVRIEDIAHHLSLQNRFSGATPYPYSVAQHSILVARLCPPEDRLWGLLHDASEAYLVDLPRPIKVQPEFAAYREAEDRAMAAICDAFGLPHETPESVKRADKALLWAEAKRFFRLDERPQQMAAWSKWREYEDKRIKPYWFDEKRPAGVEQHFRLTFIRAMRDVGRDPWPYFKDVHNALSKRTRTC